MKDLLYSSECLTDKQESELKTLKFSDEELEGMVCQLFERYDKALQLARKLHAENKAKIEALKNPPLWAFASFTKAPPDYRSKYLEEMAAKTNTN